MTTNPSNLLRRRSFLTTLGGATAFSILSGFGSRSQAELRKGRIKQCVCMGVFRNSKLDMDGMCREAARLGAYGVDLVGPKEFATLKKLRAYREHGPWRQRHQRRHQRQEESRWHRPADARGDQAGGGPGAPNVIVMAGDRKGLTDEQGLDNCVEFLNNIKALAEDQKVTLCMELLNSKVNHPGYMSDHTAWGVEVCKRVNSPRVKLLYDIYHMQIMEGDIIRPIKENIQYIGHFHTAGNPGRHEFDETQELYYPPICKAIAESGFQGYLAHEYSPTKEPLETLDKMMKPCEV